MAHPTLKPASPCGHPQQRPTVWVLLLLLLLLVPPAAPPPRPKRRPNSRSC